MIAPRDEEAIATRLIDAYDRAATLPPITSTHADFTVDDAYRVLQRIEQRRVEQGWKAVGRKIGFTNTTIWPRYGVYRPMWAHVWQHTVHHARDDRATLSLQGLVQPRIEPEIVFGIALPLPASDDPQAMLGSVAWVAPGFEIVQSHFPDWKFTAADCTAAFGLHGALVMGTPLVLTPDNRGTIADLLPRFRLTLSQAGSAVDRGVGANVLGGPAHALAHLRRVLAEQPWAPPVAPGEIVTTGTISDAWPVAPGETWSSDYGELPLNGLRLSFT